MASRNKHKGAKSELMACSWLLEEGYEVFRNVSPVGIIDIVAYKNGTTYLFDVKTQTDINYKQKLRLSGDQIKAGIKPIYVFANGTCIIDWEPKIYETTVRCFKCGTSFIAKTIKKRKYCSNKCRSTAYQLGKKKVQRANHLKSTLNGRATTLEDLFGPLKWHETGDLP